MFCISSSRVDENGADVFRDGITSSDGNLLSLFCLVDHWSANLSSAMLTMGERAVQAHGLPAGRERFGLLEFVRCYDEAKRPGIIELFERAASFGNPFHYSSAIGDPVSGPRVVHCFGRYRSIEGRASNAEIHGLFLFSRDGFVPI